MDRKESSLIAVAVAALAAAVLVCLLCPYLVIDIPQIAEAVGGPVGALGGPIKTLLGAESRFTLSGVSLISALLGGTDHPLLGAVRPFFEVCGWIVLAPPLSALICLVFLAFRKKWRFVASAVTGGAGLLSAVAGVLLLIPALISSRMQMAIAQAKEAIDSGLTEAVSKNPLISDRMAEKVISSLTEDLIRNPFPAKSVRVALLKQLGPGWWITAICLFLILILSVVALLTASRREKTSEASGTMVCAFGEFRGARIPLEAAEEIVIGSDPRLADLVVGSEWAARRHCGITWEPQRQAYRVRNLSKLPLEVNGKQVARGDSALIRRGEVALNPPGREQIRLL